MARRRKLGEILVEVGMVDEFQLRSALSDQKRWGRPLGITLVKLGFVEEAELLRVLSTQLDVPIADLRGKRISPDALARIPVDVAERYQCLPLFVKREGGRDTLYLGMEDPTNLEALDDLSFRTGLQIKPVLVGPTELAAALERYYHKLEYQDDLEVDATEFETPLEPGDTAPLILPPAMPEAGTKLEAPAPPLLDREPQPAAVQAPTAEVAAAELGAPGDFGNFEELELDEEATTPGVPSAEVARVQAPVPPDLGPEFVAKPTAAAPAEPTAAVPAKRREVPTRTILRAVTQLLIDQGVIQRDELMQRIEALSAADEGSE